MMTRIVSAARSERGRTELVSIIGAEHGERARISTEMAAAGLA